MGEAYERDHMMRLEQSMEALTQQLQALIIAVQNQQNQPQYDSGDEGLGDDDYREVPWPRRRPLVRLEEDRRQDDMRVWELGMRTEVAEYQGSLQPEEFVGRLQESISRYMTI